MKTLGETLREARNQKEMSLRDLAYDTEYSPTYISMVERGLEAPSNDYLEIMAESLDIDMRWLHEAAKRVPDEVSSAMASRRILVDIVYKLMERDDGELESLFRRL